MTLKNEAFYVDIVEHDRWSGPSSDGMFIFLSQEDAKEYIEKQYASYPEKTPEYYVNYELGGYIKVGEETYKVLKQNNKVWVKSQGELLK